MTSATGAPEQGAPASPSAMPSRAFRIEAMVVVGVLIALAIVGFVLTFQIRDVGSGLTLNARVVPLVVCSLLLVAGVGVLVGQLRGRFGEPDEGEDVDLASSTSWITTGIIALAFLSLMITIPMLGWPLGVTILFGVAAVALGAKSWWVAALVGLALGAVTQLVFGSLLGLSLPVTGTLTAWIPLG